MAQVSKAVSDAAIGQMKNVKYIQTLRFNQEGNIDNESDEEEENELQDRTINYLESENF
jgi:hypothetical protein